MGQQGFMIALGVFSMVLIPQMYQAVKINFLIHDEPLETKGNHEYAKFTDFWITAFVGIVCLVWEKLTEVLTRPIFEKLNKGQDDAMKKFYTEKMCAQCYRFQYFLAASIWGYYLFQPLGWLPWQLGGAGSINESYDSFMINVDPKDPYQKYPRFALTYCLVTMGYHFGGWMQECFLKERGSDFWEMQLHHLVTCSLYASCILANFLGYASTLFFLHDIGDIFVAIVKWLSSTNYENLTLAFYFAFVSAWFWTRLYVLPSYLWRVWIEDFDDSVVVFVKLDALMLSVLQFLHVYWFYLFILMGLHKLKTGKAEDLQSVPKQKAQ